MKFQYIPYIWPLIASAVTTVFLGIYAQLRRRHAKGSSSFILSMMVLTIWSSANALEMSSMDFETKLFWANVQYFAYCYSPVTLLALCMEFTGYDRLIRNKKVWWLLVIPTVIIILVWTDSIHGLIRYDMSMDLTSSFPVIKKKYGPAFFLHAVYSHSLNIAAWVLLIRAVFRKNSFYRKQAAVLLIALSFIVLPNIFYISGLSPVKNVDLTPIFFGPSGLIATWGIFKFNLFDVIPVAWASVIKNMDAGVMVLDLQNRILDINPAFERIVGYDAKVVYSRQVMDAYSHIPELVKACDFVTTSHTEFQVAEIEGVKVYELIISPLTDNKGILIGQLAVAHDITEKKLEQQELLRQQWKQAVKSEKERHARDMHDNLGQVLGFISLQAQGIRQELVNGGVDMVSHQLDKLVQTAQSAHNDIREYIKNARYEKVSEEDFIAELSQYISFFQHQTSIKAKLDVQHEFSWEKLGWNIKINILNIIKEALNNIRKHAEADNINVAISLEYSRMKISITDDGKGFDSKMVSNSMQSKFGISIMKERTAEIGGNLNIQSVTGEGSIITLYIPVWEEIINAL